jgi:hypothetical protein
MLGEKTERIHSDSVREEETSGTYHHAGSAGDSVGLTGVLGHEAVNVVHEVVSDGGSEDRGKGHGARRLVVLVLGGEH